MTAAGGPPTVIHVATTDMSLDWLLRPQLEAFAAAGYTVAGAAAPSGHAGALRASGLGFHPVPQLERSINPTSDAAAFAALVRLFRRQRPTIVHTHNPKPGVLGRMAARVAGVEHVVNTVHGLYAQPGDSVVRRGLVYGAERMAATCSDIELVQNPEDVATLTRIGVPADRVRLLGNGVDLDRFRPGRLSASEISDRRRELGIAPSAVVCGVVGRLVLEKGYADVFAAARRLRQHDVDVAVVVVGPDEPGKADAVPAAMIDQAESDGVRFLGSRHDMEAVYPLFDLYLLASYREGFPRSAMEAASCGLPLVVTDIRGGRQVVEDGETGFLVPVADGAAIADAVGRLAANEVLRRRMAEKSLAKARAEFDQQRQIEVTLAAYAELLARSPR